jgi:RNA polymerase sigma-70 factor (ECF subfamily)
MVRTARIRRGTSAALPDDRRLAKTQPRGRRIPGVRTGGRHLSASGGAQTGEAPGADLAALIGQVSQGDSDAFEAVCRNIAAPVFGMVRSVVRDRSQSEEVTQEVLLEVWRRAARFDVGRGSAMAWVMMIAHRRAVDRVRSEQRAAERELRAASHAVAYDEVAEEAEANLDRERVRRCLGSLTDLQREAIALAYYGGYTYRQVAARLGVAAGTVSTRMRDGLIRLRDCLGAHR